MQEQDVQNSCSICAMIWRKHPRAVKKERMMVPARTGMQQQKTCVRRREALAILELSTSRWVDGATVVKRSKSGLGVGRSPGSGPAVAVQG